MPRNAISVSKKRRGLFRSSGKRPVTRNFAWKLKLRSRRQKVKRIFKKAAKRLMKFKKHAIKQLMRFEIMMRRREAGR